MRLLQLVSFWAEQYNNGSIVLVNSWAEQAKGLKVRVFITKLVQ